MLTGGTSCATLKSDQNHIYYLPRKLQ